MSLFEFIKTSKGGVHCSEKPSHMAVKIEPGSLQHENLQGIDIEHKRVFRAENSMPDRRMFLIAFDWIQQHLSDLLQVGWTRAVLFRRGRYSYPWGNWGIAWLDVWGKDNVQIEIDKRTGAIRFTFLSADGRIVSQAVYPNAHQNKL